MIKIIDDNTIISAYRIIGTDICIFNLYERLDSIMPSVASSFTSFTEHGIDGWFGRVGTDPSKSGIEYDHLPVGDDRSAAVKAAYQSRFDHAEDTIRKYAEFNCTVDSRDGEITVNVADLTGEWTELRKDR